MADNTIVVIKQGDGSNTQTKLHFKQSQDADMVPENALVPVHAISGSVQVEGITDIEAQFSTVSTKLYSVTNDVGTVNSLNTRKNLIILNDTDQKIYLRIGTDDASTTLYTYVLYPEDYYEAKPTDVKLKHTYIPAANATGRVQITETTRTV